MSLLVVQIGKIQFSFHEINRDEIEVLLAGHDCLKTSLEWDGIRKQMCAVSTFRLSEQNVQPLLTTSGEGMADCIDSIFRDLEAGRISLRDIITVTSSSCKSTSVKMKRPKEKKSSSRSGSTIGEILKAQGIDLSQLVGDSHSQK